MRQNGVCHNNLVTITREQLDESMCFTGFTVNCQSVKAKDLLLRDIFSTDKHDFAFLTETWIKENDNTFLSCSDLNREGFKLNSVSRPTKKGNSGGGISLVTKSYIKVTKKITRSRKSFEHCLDLAAGVCK